MAFLSATSRRPEKQLITGHSIGTFESRRKLGVSGGDFRRDFWTGQHRVALIGGMDGIFVERQFELRETSQVVVRFARPLPDGNDFRCDYEIVWPDRTRTSRGFGVDEIQALLLAMEKAHVELLASPEGRRGELTYLGMRDLDLPLASSVTPDDFKPD